MRPQGSWILSRRTQYSSYKFPLGANYCIFYFSKMILMIPESEINHIFKKAFFELYTVRNWKEIIEKSSYSSSIFIWYEYSWNGEGTEWSNIIKCVKFFLWPQVWGDITLSKWYILWNTKYQKIVRIKRLCVHKIPIWPDIPGMHGLCWSLQSFWGF